MNALLVYTEHYISSHNGVLETRDLKTSGA